MAKNYYDILGVDKKATKDDVKKAFRKLAQKHHPDKGGDEAKFKEITEAYSVLGDDKKRREYDSYGQTFAGGGPGAGGFGGFDPSQFSGFGQGGVEFDLNDLFEGFGDIFGGTHRTRAKRGRDISIDIEVPFKESILGGTRSVLITKVSSCETCEGSGAKPGTEMETCKQCNGQGHLREARNTPFGQIASTRACSACDATGKVPKERCAACAGHGVLRREEELSIVIPPGMDDGEMIRMPGKGEAVKNGSAGDLYVKVHVKPHPVFRKEGMNLSMQMPVKLTDALLGTTASVTLVDGTKLEVKIPAMQEVQQTLRLKGKGVTVDNQSGDLLIRLTVTLPKKLSGKAKKAIEELQGEGL